MTLVRPRINDFHGLPFSQEDVDFAIPFLNEDIPLYVDPFLLWKSPSQADNALHDNITQSFNYLGKLYLEDEEKAVKLLISISECDEVRLGNSVTGKGTRIGEKKAREILENFKLIPQLNKQGFTHFEEVQLLVEGISKDRISDIACNLIKSHLIDYTIQKCEERSIPTNEVEITYFDGRKKKMITEVLNLPINPEDKSPILFVPKRWLRFIPWLNFDDYFKNHVAISQKIVQGIKIPRIKILEFNRQNYDAVQTYLKVKQLEKGDCKNDPLFSQIPVKSAKAKKNLILKLPTGKTDNADIKYENYLCPLLASMCYPHLDFAALQSRTVSGAQIRDLIFYNNTSHPFLKEIYEEYDCKQLVIELKNVKEVKSIHINQVNRYLTNHFGKFGVIFTRNAPPKKMIQNLIDLWAGQRRCILIMDDTDLELMSQIYEGKQRDPIDVIKKKYIEFQRSCPS